MAVVDTEALIALADRLSYPVLTQRRADFDQRAATLSLSYSDVDSFGGSAHRATLLRLGARELAHRSTLRVEQLIAAHRAMRSPSDDLTLRNCKNWMARRIAAEAAELEIHLWYPQAGPDGTSVKDTLREASKAEVGRAYALIEAYFRTAQAHPVERAFRFVARWATKATSSSGHPH